MRFFGGLLGVVVLFIAAAVISGCGGPVGDCASCECGGCGKSREAMELRETRPAVAATNSYLETAIADLTGGGKGDVEILPLAGPGSCPGHFDLRPSQIERLAECRLLVRFDFQKSLGEKLAVRVGEELPVAEITISGGMCEPPSYMEACRQIADALVECGCLERARADVRLGEISARMEKLSVWCRSEIEAAGLGDYAVAASTHQESFCRWLGLRVEASFNGGETRPSRIDEAVAAAEEGKVKLLIANLPEGRRTADMLAERLGVETVVFGNFSGSGEAGAFDELVRGNVDALVKGGKEFATDEHR